MKKLIIANWKNHPDSWGQAQQILEYLGNHLSEMSERNFSLVVCPPFVFMEEAAKLLGETNLGGHVILGAQDIAIADDKSLTGEVTGTMLQKLGVHYVIIGHSERRWQLLESDEVVNQKLKAALCDQLVPIVCIGEKVRDENYQQFLKVQIEATFAELTQEEIERCIIAYEPVWAISTNPDAKPDSPQETLEVIKFLKEILATSYKLQATSFPPILYGGSITEKNSQDFISQNAINGVLVGGASVRKEEFVAILSKI